MAVNIDRSIINKIDKMISSTGQVTPAELQQFAVDTIGFFENLKTVFLSGTEEDKKAAAQLCIDLQKKFEIMNNRIYKAMGITPEQASKFLKPAHYTKEEWQTMQNIQNNVENIKKGTLSSEELERSRTHGSKRKNNQKRA